MSSSNFQNYRYQLCPTDEMDNIKKRSGRLKLSLSIVGWIISVVYVNYFPSIGIIDQHLVNSTFINDTSDSSSNLVKNVYYVGVIALCWLGVIIISSILHRVCLLIEEVAHLKSRYGKNYWKLFSTTFSGGWNTKYILGFFLFSTFLYLDWQIAKATFRSYLDLLIISVTTLNVFLCSKVWTSTEFQHSKSHIPSTGTFMAYAAYYSYYKNVLPTLKERIIEAEQKFKIKIPFKKLVILFPSSGQISNKLDYGTDEIEQIDHLSKKEINKEGTFKRKMTNPIYKIAPKNKEPYYCVAEGQNSLPVLKSMKQSEEIFKQQAYLLYKTLKEILEDSGEKNTFLLFSYNDEEDIPLSELLWNELDKQLKK